MIANNKNKCKKAEIVKKLERARKLIIEIEAKYLKEENSLRILERNLKEKEKQVQFLSEQLKILREHRGDLLKKQEGLYVGK